MKAGRQGTAGAEYSVGSRGDWSRDRELKHRARERAREGLMLIPCVGFGWRVAVRDKSEAKRGQNCTRVERRHVVIILLICLGIM